jgi:hypothetical protein
MCAINKEIIAKENVTKSTGGLSGFFQAAPVGYVVISPLFLIFALRQSINTYMNKITNVVSLVNTSATYNRRGRVLHLHKNVARSNIRTTSYESLLPPMRHFAYRKNEFDFEENRSAPSGFAVGSMGTDVGRIKGQIADLTKKIIR